MKTYLSARQCVERLNGAVSVKLIYALIAQGKLRINRRLGKILIEEESFVELVEGSHVPVPTMPSPPVRPRGRPRKQTIEMW